MKTDFVTRTEFNKISIADFLTVSNISFLEQVQSLRHYDCRDLVPGHHEEDGERLLTVNMARNEWIDRNDRSQHGHLSDLLRYFHALPDDFDGNYAEYMQYVLDMYRYMDTLPASCPTTTVRMGMVGRELDTKIEGEVYTMMALQGISRHTVDKYCRQLKVHDAKSGKMEKMLAFPADNGNWYAFGGTSWQPVGEQDIATFGEFKKNQYCYVYENPLDFLAMMELWHRNRVENAFGSAYHLVVNGRRNGKAAQQFIRDNPDFLSVKTFFPNTTDGRQLFAEINDACKGTAVNCSYIFNGYESLSDRMRVRAPSDIFRKYLMPEKPDVKMQAARQTEAAKEENRLIQSMHRQTEMLEKGRMERELLSDKQRKGKGKAVDITLEPKRKGFGL